MIITLKGANFSTNNINDLLNSYSISYYGNGVSGSPSSVAKDIGGDLTCDLTIAEGYTYKSLSVSVGGVTLNNDQYEIIGGGDKVVIYNENITGNIMINVVTEGSVVEPDEPETPTNYTFTINPTPTTATVTLTASGYTQNGNSITVPNGTTVSWSVSASGYTTQTGTWTANGSDKTENVVLVASGGGSNALDLSTLSLAHCGSSKLGSDSNENLIYDQTAHTLKVNDTGWYKVSYFTTPVQVGTEIEYTTNYSSSVTGNFVGIYTQEDLVNGVTEVNGSFWPSPSGFGMYAPGQGSSGSADYIVIWDNSNYKIKTSDLKFGDAFNGKTIKLKMLETGVKVYVDNEEITWGTGSKLAALTTGTDYYLGFHNNCSNPATVAETVNYIGPIR